MIALPSFRSIAPNPAQARANSILTPYFTALSTAGSNMNANNRQVLRNFVVGCISDGLWDKIDAIVPLAGPSSLAGALVPLKGNAPTNFNFVAGDHNAQTGLVGNGSTKYLNTNYTSLTTGTQNDAHIACFATTASPTGYLMGSKKTLVAFLSGSFQANINESGSKFSGTTWLGGTQSVADFSPVANTFIGARRSSSTTTVWRVGSSEDSGAIGFSAAPTGDEIHVFRLSGIPNLFTTARLAFYSLGKSLDMASLRTRMGAYVNQLTNTAP